MKTITYAGIALLGAMFTSTAFAGCGKQSRFNFPAMSLREKAPLEASGGSRVSADASEAGRGNIVGLWLATVSADGQVAFQGFEAYTQDGLEFLSDNGSPIEGSVCFGIWSPEGTNIKIYHPAWNYDSSGNLIGTVVIKEQITLDAGGNAYQGTVSVEVFDLSNQSLGIVFQGTVSAKRITG